MSPLPADRKPSNLSRLAAVGAVAGIGLASAFTAIAVGTPGAFATAADEAQFSELERTFWFCDYVATTQGIQAAPVAACKYATEELKKQKFGGNYHEFLEWWRANKADEHGKLERQKSIHIPMKDAIRS